jgi:hypothetical protein
MRLYLASPNNQLQAHLVNDMPVLLSYGLQYKNSWIDRYVSSFSNLLIDSGAYSELNSGKKIDGFAYRDWYQKYIDIAEGIAGLDDISGDWKRSLKNYELYGGFPTFHDTDPPEILDELIALAYERKKWLGIGLLPPRINREDFLRRTLEKIPHDIHIHGWALRRYIQFRRFNSMDSTNWWRDMLKINKISELQHLTPAECLEIIVKRYKRFDIKKIKEADAGSLSLFDGERVA